MLRIIVFTLLFFSYAFAKANTTTTLQDTTNIARKVYRATRISTPPKIDGKPFDKIWDRVTTGGNFIMRNLIMVTPKGTHTEQNSK